MSIKTKLFTKFNKQEKKYKEGKKDPHKIVKAAKPSHVLTGFAIMFLLPSFPFSSQECLQGNIDVHSWPQGLYGNILIVTS